MINEQIVEKLANLPLIVRGSPDEVFKAVRKLQEAAQKVTTVTTPSDKQTDNPLSKRPCGHEWRNNDFDCLDCIAKRIKRLVDTLTEIRDGQFRYNMGDYETCAKNAARLALGEDQI